jgi:uncharacterized protein (TIGR03118 family)
MYKKQLTKARLITGKNSLLMITLLALSFGCRKSNVNDRDLRDFNVVNLVANTAEYHPRTWIDPTLINGFGIAWSSSANAIAWVNSVGGHVSELYNSEGVLARAPVNIPSPTDTIGGLPCGIVFSGGKGFTLPNGPAAFIFSGFDGVLSAWNPGLGNNARRINHVPNALTSYTGLAIGASGGHNYIYGANFGERKIDVWDTAFRPVAMSFKDPYLPSGYSPYNIQAVGDYLFVIYGELATSGPLKGHGIAGAGKGFVSVFGTDGSFIRRFASRGTLNLPWGVTMAPGSFLEDQDLDDEGENQGGYESKSAGNSNGNSGSGNGGHGHHDPKDPVILVGNFGDGHINVYTQDGKYIGQLQSHKHTIVIEGLWALTFPPSTATSIDPARLYFSAGPDSEADGVFGYIIKK